MPDNIRLHRRWFLYGPVGFGCPFKGYDMKTWTVYFEIFGKKMKTDVEADSFYAAQCKVKDKIIFHKTIEKSSQPETLDEAMDKLKDLFGIK